METRAARVEIHVGTTLEHVWALGNCAAVPICKTPGALVALTTLGRPRRLGD